MGLKTVLTAQIEPFDSFWEGPKDIEGGYARFQQFYRLNYLPHMSTVLDAEVLVISCGPGYFVDMLVRHGYRSVTGIDSDSEKVEYARRRDLDCRTPRDPGPLHASHRPPPLHRRGRVEELKLCSGGWSTGFCDCGGAAFMIESVTQSRSPGHDPCREELASTLPARFTTS